MVAPLAENAWDWKVLMNGPVGSPYEGGVLNFHVRYDTATVLTRSLVAPPKYVIHPDRSLQV